jgi:outer membrane protein
VTADRGTAVAAGALATSSLSDRFAYGGGLLQLITDFGRTSALVANAHYRHGAWQEMSRPSACS